MDAPAAETDAPISDQKRRKRWVWGCTGGCLGFIVVVALGVFLIFRLLARPVPLPSGELFITPQTSAFLLAHIARDDPMMAEVPARLAMLPAFRDNVPVREGRKFSLDADNARDTVRAVGPVQIVMLLEVREGEAELSRGTSLSISRFSRLYGVLARAFVEQIEAARIEELEGGVLATRDEGTVGVRGNTYMAADSREMVVAWMHRLAEQAPSGDGPTGRAEGEPFGRAYGRLDPARPVRFVMLNEHGELAGLLKWMPEGAAREALGEAGVASPRVVSLAGHVRSLGGNDAELTLFLECRDAGAAEGLGAALEEIAAGLTDESPVQDLEVERSGDAMVLLTGRVPDFPGKVYALVEYLAERAKEHEANPDGFETQKPEASADVAAGEAE
jgi:hypothetical protein